MNINETELRKKLNLVIEKLLNLGGPDNAKELEEKANQTFQNALEDSGLKDTMESKAKELNEFMESGKAQEFIDKQTQILQDGADALGKIIESDKTKELLQRQMENLNNLLNDKNKEANAENEDATKI